MTYKVFIDAGHGGSDSGAVSGKFVEKELNLTVAKEVKRLLQANGIEVKMSREDDTTVSLADRCKMANTWGADYFVSIHHNAGGGDGYDVIHSIAGGKGKELAQKIATEFQKIGQNPHGQGVWAKRGKNGDYHYVIRETKMPAVITEFAFLDSKDSEAVDTQAELMAEAKAIAKAICRQLGVEFKEPSQTQSPQKTHWGTPLLEELKQKGIISGEHSPTDAVTWAELAAVVLKILK